ncbi:kinase-like domain-containing protein [Haematococcus lacustris]
MGCASSTPVNDELEYKDVKQEPEKTEFDTQHHIPASVEAALTGSARGPDRKGVKFAGDVLDTPSSKRNGDDDGVDSVSRAVSVSGRPSRTSISAKREKSFVGADLKSIMDEHGMLNPLVSRQLSVMSHYSVRSESGSVMITPEDAEAPFKLIRLIGRGGFGNVYLGDWDEERVAIKIIAGNTNADQPEEQEWEARKERMAQMEAILMSAINHPNIVRTYKVTSHSGEHLDPELLSVERQLLASSGGGDPESGVPSFEWHIIMEFCDKGSLSRALAMFKLHEPVDSSTVNWDCWACLETLKEVVSALIFLHEHKILHGDLKAANVLLASDESDRRGWIAKVADFGLARVLKDKNHIKTQTFGTVTHMPPELLAKGTLSPSSDVYAVGVLMWELFTAEKVFKQLSDSEVILAVVTKKARPTFPSDCPSKYKFLAEKCWADMSELRPSLESLLNELENLQANLCPQGDETPPMLCKVYPTRQKPLEQYRQQLAAAAAAATQTGTASPSTLAPVMPTLAQPRPMVLGTHPVKPALRNRVSANKSTSPLGRESGHHKSAAPGSLQQGSPEQPGPTPRTKSFAGAAAGARSAVANASTGPEMPPQPSASRLKNCSPRPPSHQASPDPPPTRPSLRQVPSGTLKSALRPNSPSSPRAVPGVVAEAQVAQTRNHAESTASVTNVAVGVAQ